MSIAFTFDVAFYRDILQAEGLLHKVSSLLYKIIVITEEIHNTNKL